MGAIVRSETYFNEAATRNLIELQNVGMARPHGVTGWSKLRFGVILSINEGSGNFISTPNLYIGFCEGNTNLPADATTTDFLGLKTTAATWTGGTVSGSNYQWNITNGLQYCRRQGTTNTIGSVASTTTIIMNRFAAESSTYGFSLYFVDITVGSPNYTVQAFYRNSGNAVTVTTADFINQMTLATPVLSRHTQLTSEAIAADGTYDNVCVSWDRQELLRVHGWAVSKLA